MVCTDVVFFHSDGEADLEQVGDVMAVAGLLKLFLVRGRLFKF